MPMSSYQNSCGSKIWYLSITAPSTKRMHVYTHISWPHTTHPRWHPNNSTGLSRPSTTCCATPRGYRTTVSIIWWSAWQYTRGRCAVRHIINGWVVRMWGWLLGRDSCVLRSEEGWLSGWYSIGWIDVAKSTWRGFSCSVLPLDVQMWTLLMLFPHLFSLSRRLLVTSMLKTSECTIKKGCR